MSIGTKDISSQLWNCEHAFSTQCPKRWSELAPTDQPLVRFCSACSKNVTYCTTPEDFVRLGNAGACVAVPDQRNPSSLSRMLLGKPSLNALKSIRIQQQQAAAWWNEAIELSPTFSNDAFAEVAGLTQVQRLGYRVMPEAEREYLVRLKDAITKGPDALYRLVRTKLDGKRDNQQNIFRKLRSHFDLTLRECHDIAKRVDTANPE